MFWSQNAALYLITYGAESGTWREILEEESPWKEGMSNEICSDQVIRGFGGLWCDLPGVRQKLGSPIDVERGFSNGIDAIQLFENGIIFRDSDGKTNALAYALFDDGTFSRESY